MKLPKIDLKKIDDLEKDSEKVRKIVWGWAEKSMADPNLPWETAMQNAAEELGLNNNQSIMRAKKRGKG
ncbi:MAG: hypothetical protein ACE5KT_04685 [Methanosarcinales archaeon]